MAITRSFLMQLQRILLTLLILALPLARGAARAADEEPPTPAMPAPPSEAEQETAIQTIKQLFKQDIDAAKNPAQKVDLARKLLRQGIDTQGAPADKYSLLKMARDYAAGAGDAAVALQAVDEIGRSFNVDGLQLKFELLTALGKQQMTPAQNKNFVEATSAAMDDAIGADDFDVAAKFGALGAPAAKKLHDAEFLKQFAARSKEIEAMQTAYANVAPALKTLDDKPLDPEANYAVGYFRAVLKGDWDTGVAYLALGSDAKLKAIAVQELNITADTPEDMVKVADAWWAYAASLDATAKEHVESRALSWYSKAVSKLTGLAKLKVEQKLQEVGSRLFTRIQNAQRAKKFTVTPPVGGTRGGNFTDGIGSGGLVIGFDVGLSRDPNGEKFISMIRPVFGTANGEVTGATHGQARGETLSVKAREGYAVGGVTLKGSNRVDGLSVTFMQIQGVSLNSHNAYTSDWYGNKGTTNEVRVGGSGAPVIGLSGRTVDLGRGANFLEAISLIIVK